MKALHVLGGQVDAVAAEVLGHVLEVLDDLERRAHRVGAADPLGRGRSGDGEDQTADGVRGEFTVGEQIVVGLVPLDELVLAVGRDQAEEGLGVRPARWTVGRSRRSRGWLGVESNTR